MNYVFSLHLQTLLLLLIYVWGSSKAELDEDCYVTNTKRFNLPDDSPINLSCFITEEDPINIHISFKGRRTYQDSDLLKLKPESGWTEHKRGGEIISNDTNLKSKIPLGWNNIAITVDVGQLDIGSFFTLDGLEYEIDEISITAKYLTSCTSTNSLPMWKIDSNEVSIPLDGLSSTGIKLVNYDQSFLPELTLNEIDIPLSFNEELVIKKSRKPLPPQEYRIDIVKLKTMISLYTIFINNTYKLLMKVNVKEDLRNLSLRALEGSFTVILDPYQDNYFEEDDTERKYVLKEQLKDKNYIEPENETKYISQPPETTTTCTCNTSSSTPTALIVICGLLIGLVVILILVIVFLCRKNIYNPIKKDVGTEEGESLLLNEYQVSIKDTIRSTLTEPHGETNIQMNPHCKEVCKIKLLSDKKNDSKKIIGELETSKPTKVILVVGQTGSGKSSFINAMLNYIYGVDYEDKFRFKLIDDMTKQNTSGTNNTDDITSYYIPFMPGMKQDCNYIFIDTPGFGDARGIDEDKKWNTKFYEFLNKNSDITEVDGICFVIKSNFTRITLVQTYIINGLFSMFGKDIAKNVYVVVSYSNGSDTHVPKLLQKSGLGYKLAMDFNSKGIYNDETLDSGSPSDVQTYFLKSWKLNIKNMYYFFKDIMKTSAVCLSLTYMVLEENTDIEKLKDELLELRVKEYASTDQERQDIQSKIEQNQKLLMIKLDEAKKLSGRLETIPAKKNPLVINDYIDMLIEHEVNEDKKLELQKLKERNVDFQNLLKDKKSTKSIMKYILGEKTD